MLCNKFANSMLTMGHYGFQVILLHAVQDSINDAAVVAKLNNPEVKLKIPIEPFHFPSETSTVIWIILMNPHPVFPLKNTKC